MAGNKNFFNTFFVDEREKQVIVGENIVNLRTLPALQNLAKYVMDNRLILYVQASTLLGLAFILAFLQFLLKSRYPLFIGSQINGETFKTCYYLFGSAFFLMSFSIFFKYMIKAWLAVLMSVFVFLRIGAVFYFEPGYYYNLPAVIGDSVVMAVIFFAVFFGIGLFQWRGMFWTAFIGFVVVILYLFISLSHVNTPEIISYKDASPASSRAKGNIIHISISGLINIPYLMELQKGTSLKVSDNVIDFFIRNKFSLTPKAYTGYGTAVEETINVFNFGRFEEDNVIRKYEMGNLNTDNGVDIMLLKNWYFDIITQNGYGVNVYQDYGINFCNPEMQHSVKSCHTYYPISSLRTKEQLFGAYAASFKPAASFGDEAAAFLHLLPYDRMPIVLNQKAILDQAKNDILKASGSNLFFIQLSALRPPYTYDRNCRPLEKPDDTVAGYGEQLLCTYGLLDGFLADLRKEGVLEHSKVILHGTGGPNLGKVKLVSSQIYSLQESVSMVKDMYMSVYATSQGGSSFFLDKAPCDIGTLFLRSLTGSDQRCQPLDIKNFSLESIPDFNKVMGEWFNPVR